MQHAQSPHVAGPHSVRTISFGDAATAAFRAPGALINLLHGAIFALIPLVGQLVLYGWISEMMHRMNAGAEQPIPKLRLSDFGYWLRRGIVPFVSNLVFGMALSMVMNIVLIPLMFLGMFGAMASPEDPATFLIFFGITFIVAMGVSLLVVPFYNSAMARAELTEDFNETFDFNWIFRFAKSTYWTHLWTGAALMIFAFVISIVGMLFFFVGMFLTVPLIMLTAGHIRAQIYQRYAATTGDVAPVRTPEWCPAEAAEQLPNYYA